MSISSQILGSPGRDNALLVRIDSGQAVERLLFDCGEGCLAELPVAEVLKVDHLCFSHLHMDHVSGFDSFFRCNYDRDSMENRIWGPPETARIMHGRFQGFLWNLHKTMSGSWLVSDIHPEEIRTKRFELREAFAVAHGGGTEPHEDAFCEGAGFTAEAVLMDQFLR
ncbi:MAG: MBL fold metallo-hydrolase [Candidatus Eisenbacteria sp.]|nr:MBL fold metallo-hydrolase [Candidatus Eisenbacteria bacterium]